MNNANEKLTQTFNARAINLKYGALTCCLRNKKTKINISNIPKPDETEIFCDGKSFNEFSVDASGDIILRTDISAHLFHVKTDFYLSKREKEDIRKDVQFQRKDILENEETCPVLAYGKAKDFNEKQLKNSGKKFIIIRLVSVYGYSTDTARIDIMANFFSKTASQNGILKLFGGGRQLKSLVPLIDVARCFKFMEERDDISFETFNLCKDTVTVKDVAEICKKYNPKITLKETNDEIPNLGFSLFEHDT